VTKERRKWVRVTQKPGTGGKNKGGSGPQKTPQRGSKATSLCGSAKGGVEMPKKKTL